MDRVARPTAASMSDGGALTAPGSYDLGRWRVRVVLLAAALACAVALGLAILTAPPAPNSRTVAPRHGLQRRPGARLSIGLAAAASSSIGASERSFWEVRRGGSLLTQGGGIHSTFTSSGAALRLAHGTLALSLTAVGHGQRLDRVAAAPPSGSGNQVIYRRGSIGESYRNGPYGLEQGFTVAHRPQGGPGSLVLALGIGGSLIGEKLGSEVLFRTRAGATALRYGQLSAVDAKGRSLPAHMQIRNGRLELRIDDSHARYPLRIDPFLQQGGKLAGGEETGNGRFGYSVALSSDGNTALIGGWHDNVGDGAAWVFTRSGSTWTQQGSKLTGDEEWNFGNRVALSGNGNTALVGAPGNYQQAGAAWVFTRSGETWTKQGKLTGNGATGDRFGYNVALSSEGNTALIGEPGDSSSVGAAWVFTRSDETWTKQGPKLTGSGESGKGLFGEGVALSSSGNTALIGGPFDNERSSDSTGLGAAWVFTRSGSTWTQQGEKLTGSGESEAGRFGQSVALSSEGNTALIGGPNDGERVGAGWVFTRSGSTWTQQGPKLTGRGESGKGLFGQSVALSADGNTALIQGSLGKSGEYVGAAWVFTRSGSTWTQQEEKLTANNGETIKYEEYGSSVALSGDANTALIGGPDENEGVGAAWVFARAPVVVTGAASAVTQSAATLNATVNPNGQTVSDCHFEYGFSEAYESTVPCASLPGSGESPVAVSAAVTGLAPGNTYHFRIVATNPLGTSFGHDQTFATLQEGGLPSPPTVVTGSASAVKWASATLNAIVNPNSGEVSNCHFAYGTTLSYGSTAPCTPSPGSGSGPVAVSASVTGLAASTTYHFRIIATNQGGTSRGADQTFKTLASGPHYYRNGVLIPEGERVPVLEWGQLTFEPEPGGGTPTICETAAGGFVENSEAGGPGVGQTTSFASWNCSDLECPQGEVEFEGHKYEKAFELIAPPQDLPWPTVLTETGKVIRANSAGVVLTLGCYLPKLTRSEKQTGKATGPGENEQYPLAAPVTCETNTTHLWEPQHQNGTNLGNNQSKLIFNQPAGSGPSCAGGGITARISQSLKVMGYGGSELITVKNP